MWVGIIQLPKVWIEWNSAGKLTLLPDYLSWNVDLPAMLLVLASHLIGTYTSGSLAQAFRLHHWPSWISSLQTEISGPLSPHNCMSQYLTINFCACHPEMLTSWAAFAPHAASTFSLPFLRFLSVPMAEQVLNYWNYLTEKKDVLFPILFAEKWPFCITLVPWGPWKQTSLKKKCNSGRISSFYNLFIHSYIHLSHKYLLSIFFMPVQCKILAVGLAIREEKVLGLRW